MYNSIYYHVKVRRHKNMSATKSRMHFTGLESKLIVLLWFSKLHNHDNDNTKLIYTDPNKADMHRFLGETVTGFFFHVPKNSCK